MAFDVKTTNPNKTIHDSIASRSINLMCAITEGLTYTDIYAKSFHYTPTTGRGQSPPLVVPVNDPRTISPLDKMIQNIYRIYRLDRNSTLLKGASNEDRIVHDRLIGANGALLHIKYGLVRQNYPDLRLGKLFHTMVAEIPEPEKAGLALIITELEQLHDYDMVDPLKDQMYHFCAPFLTIQNNRIPVAPRVTHPKRMPTQGEFEDRSGFLGVLGGLRMQQLYDVNVTDYATNRAAAKNALNRCILKEYRPTDSKPPQPPGPVMGTDGNNMHCESDNNGGTHCVSCGTNPEHPDDWCNDYEDTNGVSHCSLGSDYHI
jgi:hypothetical protein